MKSLRTMYDRPRGKHVSSSSSSANMVCKDNLHHWSNPVLIGIGCSRRRNQDTFSQPRFITLLGGLRRSGHSYNTFRHTGSNAEGLVRPFLSLRKHNGKGRHRRQWRQQSSRERTRLVFRSQPSKGENLVGRTDGKEGDFDRIEDRCFGIR